MLICPACAVVLTDVETRCGNCGFAAENLNGFLSWAPALEKTSSGFNSDNFSKLAKTESESFWFKARNKLIIWALKKYFSCFDSLLEIGCGTGFVLTGIADSFPCTRLVGSEIFSKGLNFASARLPNAELIQADARSLPYKEEFDVVAAFDVIEHIFEDELALSNLYRATKSGGGCIITVPQHEFLWSLVDEEACHVRRYEPNDLHRKIESAGFRIVMSTSFVSFLLPLMWYSRSKGNSQKSFDSISELRPHPVINASLECLMSIERLMIRLGFRFPMGGSRLVVALKESSM